MKQLFLILILVLSGCTNHYRKADEQSIRAVMAASQKAWNIGSIERFMKSYARSDSICIIGNKGANYGYYPVLENYLCSYLDRSEMGRLEYSNLDIEFLSRNAALVVGQWRLYRATDEPHGWFTLIFRKIIDNRWLMVHDHSSGVGGRNI